LIQILTDQPQLGRRSRQQQAEIEENRRQLADNRNQLARGPASLSANRRFITYTVKRGDTLSAIAELSYGMGALLSKCDHSTGKFCLGASVGLAWALRLMYRPNPRVCFIALFAPKSVAFSDNAPDGSLDGSRDSAELAQRLA
jgi:hypothetical protein